MPVSMPITLPEADLALYAIVALLPLSALMVVVQVNPYHALVIRGILGAVAALVYALLGAADVALTEALVGTMLAITLYAVAVRSSLLMRLGILAETGTPREQADPDQTVENQEAVLETSQAGADPLEPPPLEPNTSAIGPCGTRLTQDQPATTGYSPPHNEMAPPWQQMLADLRRVLDKRYLRLELVSYPDLEALQQALHQKEVHAICTPGEGDAAHDASRSRSAPPLFHTQIRIRRLYDILQAELTAPSVRLTYAPVTNTPVTNTPVTNAPVTGGKKQP